MSDVASATPEELREDDESKQEPGAKASAVDWLLALFVAIGAPLATYVCLVRWHADANVAIFAYVGWALVAIAFTERLIGKNQALTANRKRVLPLRLPCMGLALSSALIVFATLKFGSLIHALVFVGAGWCVMPFGQFRRLGVALPGAASAVLLLWLTAPVFGPLGLVFYTDAPAAVVVAAVAPVLWAYFEKARPEDLASALAYAAHESSDRFTVFRNLTVNLDRHRLLRNQSLEVAAGEVVAIMGPSGVGKSVLADIVFRLEGRTRDVECAGELGMTRQFGGLVFQQGGGIAYLSVGENLKIIGSNRRQRQALVEDFELDPNQLVSTLSGGEQRRVMIARCLLASRRLIWLDEPDAGLDLKRVEQLGEMLKERGEKDRVAIVVSTHNLDFAEAVADRILFFDHEGCLTECANSGDFEALVAELYGRFEESGGDALQRERGDHALELVGPHGDAARKNGSSFGDWMAHFPKSVLLLPLVIWNRTSLKSLFRAFYLCGVRTVAYYPFIGAIFASVIVLTFHVVLDAYPVSAAFMLGEVGPTLILRTSPAIAAILIAACAGATITSWIGQMTAERQFDSLTVLGVSPQRWVLGPAWWGYLVAATISAVAFAFTLASVFVVYIWKEAGASDETFVGLMVEFQKLLVALVSHSQYGLAISKVIGYNVLIVSIAVGVASDNLRTSSDVAAAITRGIIWATVAVMAAELLVVVSEVLTYEPPE